MAGRAKMALFNGKGNFFSRFASHAARWAGTPIMFTTAITLILIWAITGPLFHFSDTWQLVINTSTTIITFLMVFLIQNTQNRDSEALHLKLDELISVNRRAKNKLLNLEELTQEELDQIKRTYLHLAETADEARSTSRPRQARPGKSNPAAGRMNSPEQKQ